MNKEVMSTRERFHAVMNRQPVDRLPVVEWAPWWDQTIERWRSEGLPESLQEGDINRHFGLDPYVVVYPYGTSVIPQFLAESRRCSMPWASRDHGTLITERVPTEEVGAIYDVESYERIRKCLYPWPVIDRDWWTAQAEAQARGEFVLWCEIMGHFFIPRDLLGMEEHLYAFYDQPQLIHRINADLTAYHLRLIEEICAICRPDLVCICEDMCYNHGPMLSSKMFDEFLKPYYQQVIPRLREYEILTFVDCDGDITIPAGWFQEVGVDGMLPLERKAGVDVAQLRKMYPQMRYIGGFDKTEMNRGERAMRAEFERLLPAAKQGGFIISCDHQTPPSVSYADYQHYLRLFREYALKAAQGQ